MKLFKLIDILVQIILMLLIVYAIIDEWGFKIISVIVSLGVAQLISTGVHLTSFKQFSKTIPRKIYYWLLLIAFLAGIFIGFITFNTDWDELEALSYFTYYTFGMALYYFGICVRELLIMKIFESQS